MKLLRAPGSVHPGLSPAAASGARGSTGPTRQPHKGRGGADRWQTRRRCDIRWRGVPVHSPHRGASGASASQGVGAQERARRRWERSSGANRRRGRRRGPWQRLRRCARCSQQRGGLDTLENGGREGQMGAPAMRPMNGGHGTAAEKILKWALPRWNWWRGREHAKEEGEAELRAR
jgi:hypothetical protein